MREWLLQTRKWLSRLTLVGLTKLLKLGKLCSPLVPYRFGLWTGGMIGLAAYYLLPRERKRTIDHLTFAYSDKGKEWVRKTARRCFVHLGKALLEMLLMTPYRLSRVVDVEGEENIRAALRLGKGAIYVTGHIGNWELMAHIVASRFTLSVIAAPIEPEQVNDMLVGLRADMGVKTILRGRPGAVKEIIRVFKENRIMGILIDQDTDVESAFVDFMGKPAWTPTAAASMAAKFGVPVIFGYIHRNWDNRHTIRIEGPLDLTVTDDKEKDIITNTAMLTKKIENCIRAVPEQWVWMHRRWRRQP